MPARTETRPAPRPAIVGRMLTYSTFSIGGSFAPYVHTATPFTAENLPITRFSKIDMRCVMSTLTYPLTCGTATVWFVVLKIVNVLINDTDQSLRCQGKDPHDRPRQKDTRHAHQAVRGGVWPHRRSPGALCARARPLRDQRQPHRSRGRPCYRRLARCRR